MVTTDAFQSVHIPSADRVRHRSQIAAYSSRSRNIGSKTYKGPAGAR